MLFGDGNYEFYKYSLEYDYFGIQILKILLTKYQKCNNRTAKQEKKKTLPDSCSLNFELRKKAIFKSRLSSLLINIFVAWQQPTRTRQAVFKDGRNHCSPAVHPKCTVPLVLFASSGFIYSVRFAVIVLFSFY